MEKNIFKKGMSLVEMLVAIFILGLGMIGFTILAARTWKTKSYALEAASATAGATRTLTQITHELRNVRQGDDGSYPIKALGQNSLVVYRDEDNDNFAERVHYFLEDGKLKKGVSKSVEGIYPASENVQVLLNYVTNADFNEPLFYYYNNDYPAIIQNAMTNPTPYDVRLVRVHIWVNIRPIVAPDNVNLEGFAEMRNLNEF